MLLPQYVQRPVATNREKPLGQVAVDRGELRSAKLQKGFLYDVARGFGIAQQAARIQRQRPFEASHRVSDPRFVPGVQILGITLLGRGPVFRSTC